MHPWSQVCRGGVTVEVKPRCPAVLLPLGSRFRPGLPGGRRVPPWMPVNGSACRPTHNPMRWFLPVTPGISTGHGFLFGGCALGAAISALEGSTGRSVVWATAQYLSYARPPSVMDIDVTVAVGGPQHHPGPGRRHGRQHRDPDGERRAGRSRRSLPAGSGRRCPTCRRRTSACPREGRMHVEDSIMSRLDQRWAHTDPEHPGATVLWSRLPDVLEVSAAGARGDGRLRAARHRPGARRRTPPATASTTRCGWAPSCPPSGCSSTSASSSSPAASATAPSTSGRPTAP